MNAKILVITSLIIAAGVIGYGQAPTPQPAPPAAEDSQPPAEPLAVAQESVAKESASADQPEPKVRKKARGATAASKGGQVRIETRDGNGDVTVRRFDGEGAPGVYERRVERFDNESGPMEKEVRIYHGGNPDHEDMIIRRGPNGPGGMRAEIDRPRIQRGPGGFGLGPLSGMEATPERMEHLQEAIRQLHAAGLDPLADSLQARVDRFHAEQHGPGNDRGLREEIERLKEEHQKLQQELRKLQRAKQSNKGQKPGGE